MAPASADFDWNRARTFLATAEAGSFSGAARELGTTQPTVGRQIAALEQELGVTLFERTSNELTLTPAGLSLLEHVRSMAHAATQVSLAATGQALSLTGNVAITASEAISAHLLPPVVRRLRAEHPGIEIELVVSNKAQDLQRREADIAVRNFRTTRADLYARKLRDTYARMYATPAYLESVGGVASAEDLRKVEIIGFDRADIMIDGLKALGIHVTRSQFPLVTENHLVQWELCKAGIGICIMMEEIGDAEPRVVPVAPAIPAIPIPIWLVCHRELHTNRRIRLVFERLAEGLSSPLGATEA